MAKSVLDKEPQAKALWHAGKSLTQIREKTGVSKMTLLKWKAKYNWSEKGANLPELERKEEKKLEDIAARHGITKAKVFAKIAEHIDAQSLAVITTQGAVSLAPMQPGSEVTGGKGEFMGIQYDAVPDRKTQAKAIDQAISVLGLAKVQIDATDEFRTFFNTLKGTK